MDDWQASATAYGDDVYCGIANTHRETKVEVLVENDTLKQLQSNCPCPPATGCQPGRDAVFTRRNPDLEILDDNDAFHNQEQEDVDDDVDKACHP